AGLLRNPSLDFSVRFPENSVGGVNTELSIFENLLNLFLLPARKKLATQQFEQAKLRLANDIFQVVGKVRQEFYSLQALQQLGRLRRTVLKAAEVSARLAERQHQAQNIGALEFETQRGLYQQAKLDLARDELQLQVQQERINRLLGLWGEQTRWKVQSELQEIPREELPLDQLESAALSRRLDVASARMETEILSQALDLAKTSRFVGTLDLGISRGTGPERGIRVIGPAVRLELPIFDQRQAMIRRLEAQLRQSEKRFTALSVDARSEVRSARIALISARQVIEHYREFLLPNRERVVALSQQRYNVMQLGVFQVLLAKQAQVEAYRQYIEAVRDYWIARVELDRSAGGSVPIPSFRPAGSPAKTQEPST
ncbi:MAG TPA: TolC family protein, partial [Myxococcaceae bacterium]|nr:TolC family protein [Myxococcaceae bacterium]